MHLPEGLTVDPLLVDVEDVVQPIVAHHVEAPQVLRGPGPRPGERILCLNTLTVVSFPGNPPTPNKESPPNPSLK